MSRGWKIIAVNMRGIVYFDSWRIGEVKLSVIAERHQYAEN